MFKILLIKLFIIVAWQCKKDDMENLKPKQNQLKDSQSPYLLQHASNPVDWFPWGSLHSKKRKKKINRSFYPLVIQHVIGVT